MDDHVQNNKVFYEGIVKPFNTDNDEKQVKDIKFDKV